MRDFFFVFVDVVFHLEIPVVLQGLDVECFEGPNAQFIFLKDLHLSVLLGNQ